MSEHRPLSVAIAAGLLIVDAMFCALSVNVLAHIDGLGQEQVLKFHPLVWIPAVLQIAAAAFLLRRVSWIRYIVALIVLALIADSAINTSWIQAHASFPAATLRDVVSSFLQALSVVLLFLPSASKWFSRAQATSSAA
jgi:hypothetical protein